MTKNNATKMKDEKGRPVTWDHLKSSKKRPTRKIVIPLDDEMAARWQELEGRVAFAKLRIDTGIEDRQVLAQVLAEQSEAKKEMDKFRSQMGDNVVMFKIQGLGRKKYSALQEDHPPTEEQKKMARERDVMLNYNTDTFPPVLIHACLTDPDLSLKEVQEMWDSDDWTTAELLTLFNAAVEVNEQVRNVNWGKG